MPFPHTHIKLTEAELKIVTDEMTRYAREGKIKKRSRLQILYLSHTGETLAQMANLHLPGFAYRTVKRWIGRYRKEGLKPFVHPDIVPPERNKSV
jgi:hypothetical protein